MLSLDDSFLHISDKEKFHILNVSDANFSATLDHADKYCLTNQALNLRFLVWHALVNTNYCASDSNDSNEVLPYCEIFVLIFLISNHS